MNRLDLDKILREIMSNGNVYFQPNENVRMKYPCIRYSLYRINSKFGDNHPYVQKSSYQVILIDPNPDNEYVDKLKKLPLCNMDRFYISENLNHYVFTIYI